MAAAGSGLGLTFGTWLTSLELESALVDFFSMLVGSCFELVGVDKNMRIVLVGLLLGRDFGTRRYGQRAAHGHYRTRHHRSMCELFWRLEWGRNSLRVHLQNASVASHLRNQYSLETGSCWSRFDEKLASL